MLSTCLPYSSFIPSCLLHYLSALFIPFIPLSDACLTSGGPIVALSLSPSNGPSTLSSPSSSAATSYSGNILKTPGEGRQEPSWRRPFRGPRDKYLHRLRCRGRETNMRLNQDFHRTTHLCAVSDSMYYIHCSLLYTYLNEIQRMSDDLSVVYKY